MPLDPGVKTLLDQVALLNGPSTREVGPVQAREAYKLMAALDGEPVDLARVEDVTVAGRTARLYASSTDASLPVLVWYHGGGFTIGDLDTADRQCRRLAAGSGALVVSIDYRLSPEHPFPEPYDDCIAALHWLVDNVSTLGGDASRIAVGGDSAGGNFSAVVALHARDEGIPLRFQLLVYPVIDCTMTSESYVENAEGYLLTADTMDWFVGNYLGGTTDPKDPKVSPIYADDVAGVAPALVITAEFDPLRDEGEAYAERLREAGVDAEVRRFDGQIHSFFTLSTITPGATEAMDLATSRLKTAL